jgi:hypothetical protein
LRNGSGIDPLASQNSEANQHCQHAFELPIQMNLVAGQSLKPIRVRRLTKSLISRTQLSLLRMATNHTACRRHGRSSIGKRIGSGGSGIYGDDLNDQATWAKQTKGLID